MGSHHLMVQNILLPGQKKTLKPFGNAELFNAFHPHFKPPPEKENGFDDTTQLNAGLLKCLQIQFIKKQVKT